MVSDLSGTWYHISRPSITEFLTPFDGIDSRYCWGCRTIYVHHQYLDAPVKKIVLTSSY